MKESKTNENYLSVTIREPNLFVSSSTQVMNISNDKGIKANIGKLEIDSGGSNVIQSLLFEKDKWEIDDVKYWVKEHGENADWICGKNKIINLSNEGDEEMKPMKKTYACELKNFNDEARTFDAIASTESVDRDGDILRANGWKLKNFKKNPVVLWGHNASALPIGKATDVRVENDKLIFTPQFASAEMNPFADQVFQMFKAGFLKTFSVRFDPSKWEELPPKDEKNPYSRRGREYKSQELLEISAVNIPANPEALVSRDFQNMILKGYTIENIDVVNDEAIKKEIMENSNFSKQGSYQVEEFKTGIDIKAGQEKAGRVLSAKNLGVVQTAIDALNALLKANNKPDEDEEAKAIVAQLQGDIDNIKEQETILALKDKINIIMNGITVLEKEEK